MATHGVLLGAVLGAALFCRLRKKSLLALADELVIPGSVLMALGRIGNHINGEVYGTVTAVCWAVQFPYAPGARHPVALYEGVKNLLLVPILLVVWRRRPRPRGVVFAHFVFWYGFLRVFTDYFRDYDSYWIGIGRGQYFNLLMALCGLGLIVWLRRRAGPAGPAVSGPAGDTPGGIRGFIKSVLFYVLLAFCLTIPSGWTQAVLETFRARAGD